MNWNLAIEKNRAALKRVLAMMIAMVGFAADGGSHVVQGKTLPRHLHRYVLSLLRPAESAVRRLVIIAARGLIVKVRPWRPRLPRPEVTYVLERVGGRIASVPLVSSKARRLPTPQRNSARTFALFDPLQRAGFRHKDAPLCATRDIWSFGDPGLATCRPIHPLASRDEALDATRLCARLEAIRRVLDDLTGHAERLARWTARRDERLAREGSGEAAEAPIEDTTSRRVEAKKTPGNATAANAPGDTAPHPQIIGERRSANQRLNGVHGFSARDGPRRRRYPRVRPGNLLLLR